jgi:lipopolysaccharide export LptBFGC system permease protein LptF
MPPYTREKTKTNKTKNTTQYVLDTTIHKRKDKDKQNKKHNTTQYVVVSNTYCVVFFVLFVFVFSLVYGVV